MDFNFDANHPLSIEMAALARQLVRRRVDGNDTAGDLMGEIYRASDDWNATVDRGARVTLALTFVSAVLVHSLATETGQSAELVLDTVFDQIGFDSF